MTSSFAAPVWFEQVDSFNPAAAVGAVCGQLVDFGALSSGYMAVDWVTFVMNNSGAHKEGIGHPRAPDAGRYFDATAERTQIADG